MLLYRLFSGSGNVYEKLISVIALLIVGSFSLVIHEIAHGYVAKWNGDLTAKNQSRLSLNPFVHFDIVGLLFVLIVGFGWARPVPIDPRNFKDRKKGIVSVSIAGVSANCILGGISLLLLYILGNVFFAFNVLGTRGLTFLYYFLLYVALYGVQINFMLALFNILPIYPLDGFVLLNTFLPPGNAYSVFMRKYGTYLLIGIILVGQISSLCGFKYLDLFGLFNEMVNRLAVWVLGQGMVA